MNVQQFRNLQEAYLKVFENQQLDEISAETALSASKKASEVAGQLATLGGRSEDVKKKRKQAETLYTLQAKKRTAKVTMTKEEIDIIVSHLLDEGYAETPEAAEAIMANMSEEWRNNIIG
jgi:phage tail sheath gpL-like